MGVILLVRHGQASFGAADYDRLSGTGHSQARRLGEVLAARGFVPARVHSGSMRRQVDTAQSLVESARWDLAVEIDRRWNEFDHLGLVATRSMPCTMNDSRRFQDSLDAAMTGWAAGTGPPHSESFEGFTSRAEATLRDLAASLSQGENALVVSSAGVISWLATMLISGAGEQWVKLNRVSVNTGVTKLVVGRRGTSLVAFNDHAHLDDTMTTYR